MIRPRTGSDGVSGWRSDRALCRPFGARPTGKPNPLSRQDRVPPSDQRQRHAFADRTAAAFGFYRSAPKQAPPNHGGLKRAAGFAVTPFAVDPPAGERQLVSAALILAQHL